MVLKDAECVKCGAVQELFVEMAETAVNAHCKRCDDGKPKLHRTICNGNTRFRYRCNDIPPDLTGYVDSGGCFAGHPDHAAIDTPDESKSATPDRHWNGDVIHERERFTERVRQERRAERRDKQRNADGRAPLYFNT